MDDMVFIFFGILVYWLNSIKIFKLCSEKIETMKSEKVNTSVNIDAKKFKLFKVIAMLKFEKTPITSAWEEAIDLFIKKNKEYLDEIKE